MLFVILKWNICRKVRLVVFKNKAQGLKNPRANIIAKAVIR